MMILHLLQVYIEKKKSTLQPGQGLGWVATVVGLLQLLRCLFYLDFLQVYNLLCYDQK
jgi:hypothetical protein